MVPTAAGGYLGAVQVRRARPVVVRPVVVRQEGRALTTRPVRAPRGTWGAVRVVVGSSALLCQRVQPGRKTRQTRAGREPLVRSWPAPAAGEPRLESRTTAAAPGAPHLRRRGLGLWRSSPRPGTRPTSPGCKPPPWPACGGCWQLGRRGRTSAGSERGCRGRQWYGRRGECKLPGRRAPRSSAPPPNGTSNCAFGCPIVVDGSLAPWSSAVAPLDWSH